MSDAAAAGPETFDDGHRLRLFAGYGIELEYMIVARDDLHVLPISDEVLRAATGAYTCDFEEGKVAWSNELVLHVIELKTNGPTPSLAGWSAPFLADLRRIESILEPLGGRLLPTGMHPTMDPARETRLWPHEYNAIYAAYDRIFGCTGHGWANLQSCHLNLPFQGDDEFGLLHAAIRVLLPALPALAASTPVLDAQLTGFLDNRLEVYRTHQSRIPSAMGDVIPEPVFTRRDYEERILARMYRDIAPKDPAGILQHEFLNARGAIARFERDAIEIRVLDVQETPRADLAIAYLATEALKVLASEVHVGRERLFAFETAPLAALLRSAIRDADEARIADPSWMAAFGIEGAATLGEFWRALAPRILAAAPAPPELREPLDVILRRGPLARRLLRALGPSPDRDRIRAVYGRLAGGLAADRMFVDG